MNVPVEHWWTLATIIYAMLLGGAVGFERELKDRPAGFRTHMLVSGAAAFLVGLGMLMVPDLGAEERIRVDPLRLVESVVSGVAFIGAGTIFAARGSNTVAGITTAASLLMVAAIGAAVGLGYYLLATGVTVISLFVLAMLGFVERHWVRPKTKGAGES